MTKILFAVLALFVFLAFMAVLMVRGGAEVVVNSDVQNISDSPLTFSPTIPHFLPLPVKTLGLVVFALWCWGWALKALSTSSIDLFKVNLSILLLSANHSHSHFILDSILFDSS